MVTGVFSPLLKLNLQKHKLISRKIWVTHFWQKFRENNVFTEENSKYFDDFFLGDVTENTKYFDEFFFFFFGGWQKIHYFSTFFKHIAIDFTEIEDVFK